MNQSDAAIAMQFDDADQQRSAVTFGMWIFLTTEVLFFGGMFVAYAVYRFEYAEAFQAGSRHVNLWAGGAMTAILLTGSLLVAMSDHLLEESGDGTSGTAENETLRKTILLRLAATAVLGAAFLGCEFYEYYMLMEERLFPGAGFDGSHFAQLNLPIGSAQIFFVLFFCMTGLHAFHMIVGVSLVCGMAAAIRKSRQPRQLRNALKVIGLYWHFVDIVWLFLYPLFYLVR